jgi:hypothetical protein
MNLDLGMLMRVVVGETRPIVNHLRLDRTGGIAEVVDRDGRRYQLTLRPVEEAPHGKEPAPVPETAPPTPPDPRPAPSAPAGSGPTLSAVEAPEDPELVPTDATKPKGLSMEEHFRRLLRLLAGQQKLPAAMRERCTFLADHAVYDAGDSKRLLAASNRFHDRGDCAPLLTVLLDMRDKVPRPKLVRS